MLLKEWRNEILQANLELQRKSCRLYIFGNASGISSGKEPVVIKPNGVAYEVLTAERLLVTNLQGRVVGGDLRPSSHLATRLVQYKKLASVAASRTPTPSMQQRGRRHCNRSYASAPLMPTTSNARLSSPSRCATTRLPPLTRRIVVM